MDAVRKVYQNAEPNLTLIGWMGFFGFPVYYYVWTYMFPQSYESLGLRIFCSLLFLVIALRHHVPNFVRRYLPIYFSISISVCLPFFFSYMMFKNDWSTVWVMSFMASTLIHILLVCRTSIVIAQAVIAVLAAMLLVYGPHIESLEQSVLWQYVPIFVFNYMFGTVFYRRNQSESESRVSIAKSFGAGIAHEMRNPLSALKATIDVLDSLLPNPKGNQQQIELSNESAKLAKEVIADANEAIRSGTETIDLLLTSIDENRITNASYRKHSMRELVQKSLNSFSYQSPQHRQSVQMDLKQDFSFFGSDTLLKYALYNLLKNAFYYGKRDQFKVEVELKHCGHYNELIFRDNGIGMSSDVRNQIFEDFYTYGKTGGYGLGLPFCYKVMQAMGGKISCRSELNQFTEFTLSFPLYSSDAVAGIKSDLLKSKSALYVGGSMAISRVLDDTAFYKGYKFIHLEVEEALARGEYEFEYDLIFVDINCELANRRHLEQLEAKLGFTEARIVYLFDKEWCYYHGQERPMAFYPLEKQRLMKYCNRVTDELFFESPMMSRQLVSDERRANNENTFQGKRVLLADDNHSFRAYTAILLQQQGFEVVQAKNGQEALEYLPQSRFDLVLMDIEMPTLNGLEATTAIRAMYTELRQLPIIGYTGDSSSEMVASLTEAGFNDYLVKPADTETILQKIRQWL